MSENLNVKQDYWMTCPYDKSHLLTIEDTNRHLEACRKRYIQSQAAEGREAPIQSCFFNPTHQIPQLEIQLHEILCEDSLSAVLGQFSRQNDESSEQVNQQVDQQKQDCSGVAGEPELMGEIGNWGGNEFAGNYLGSDRVEEMIDLEEREWDDIYEEFEQEDDKDSGYFETD